MEDIYSSNRPYGVKTKEHLDKNNIVSPKTNNMIQIKAGFWAVPNKPLTSEKEIDAFIEKHLQRLELGKKTKYKVGAGAGFK